MKACVPYLERQIALFKPKIILLAGATAIKGLLNIEKCSITKMRGQWIQWKEFCVMPIFHPAYLLRQNSRETGSPKCLTCQDIKEVYKKYQELT